VFIAKITDEFRLGLEVLSTHDASLDLGLHVLWENGAPEAATTVISHSHMNADSEAIMPWSGEL
jgi:hypothetical protein